MGTITLIVGGARSGKSSLALERGLAGEQKRVFVATAEAFDEEMKERIALHKNERREKFATIEEPLDLPLVLRNLENDVAVKTVVIDCLTVWLGNLYHYRQSDQTAIEQAIEALVHEIVKCSFDLVLVANEVGLGIVPETRLGRDFRDAAGRLNRKVAQKAHKVLLCVCGIPVTVK